jgi:putative MATE family efflux protein
LVFRLPFLNRRGPEATANGPSATDTSIAAEAAAEAPAMAPTLTTDPPVAATNGHEATATETNGHEATATETNGHTAATPATGTSASGPPSEPPAAQATATPEPPPEPAMGGRRGGRRSQYASRDLTEGNITKNLWFLAWPQALAGTMRTADQLADIFWAGLIDYRAIAGVGISQHWAGMFNTGRGGMDTAARAMISRAYGAKNVALANHIAMQSILLNSMMSLTWIIPATFFSEYLLRVLGVSEELTEHTLWYMRLRFLGSFPFMLTLVTSSTLSAAGDTLTPARSQVINRTCNIALMPFFVLGLGPLPEMGLAGTGLAFLLAQLPGCFLNFRALFLGTSRLKLNVSDIGIDAPQMWRQIKLGAPASVTSAERSVAQMLVIGLISPFGDLPLAAYSLTTRLHNIVNLGHAGLGQATGIIVGQNLGAGKPARVKETVRTALFLTTGLTVVIAVIMGLFPRPFMLPFTRDEALLDVGSDWLRIMCVGFIVGGLGTVFVQAINTAGDTMVPMLVTLGTIWLVQQPAAYILSGNDWTIFGVAMPFTDIFDMGANGVAWAMVLAQAVRLFFYYPYYLSGRWMKKEVL